MNANEEVFSFYEYFKVISEKYALLLQLIY